MDAAHDRCHVIVAKFGEGADPALVLGEKSEEGGVETVDVIVEKNGRWLCRDIRFFIVGCSLVIGEGAAMEVRVVDVRIEDGEKGGEEFEFCFGRT